MAAETPVRADLPPLLLEARERFDGVVEYEATMREQWLEDVRFVAGDQWPDRIKQARETDPYGPRPCLVINRVKLHVKNIVNDIRQNRPQIKVLPVDDNADPETAKMLNGLLRHVQVRSDADIAYDTATEAQVPIGVGYFRIATAVSNEELNLQDAVIEPINNLFAVYMDPMAQHPAGADAEYAFVVEEMPREQLERAYPKVSLVDWDDASRDTQLRHWYPGEHTVRLAEYWSRREDGTVVVAMLLGDQILSETVFPSRYIGIVRVLGEVHIIDGRKDIRGLVRDLRDPQRMYNYWSSLNTERIALAPKAPYIGEESAFEGHEDAWGSANTANVPYLAYNGRDDQGDPIAPPRRADSIQQDTALINAMMQAVDDIKAVSGQFDASLGQRSNETSGRAIMARQREGDTANYHYVDNLTRAIRHAGRILLDMLPRLYDTERVARILGEDDTPSSAQIAPGLGQAYLEQRDATGAIIERLYDLSVGEYDVVVSVGPSYATKRQEAFDSMSQILTGNPQLWTVMGDLLVRSMDWPGAEDMADRLKALLPPEVKAIADARADGQDGARVEAQAMMDAQMAEIQPHIEQLQMALQAAGQESDEKDQMIAQLSQAVEDKAGELAAKRYEADAKLEAERIETEGEVMVAAIQAASGEREEHGEQGEASNVVEHPGLQSVLAAQAAQQAQATANELAEVVAGQVEQAQALAASAAATVEQTTGATQGLEADVAALRGELAAQAQRRDTITREVFSYLRGEQDEEALERAVMGG